MNDQRLLLDDLELQLIEQEYAASVTDTEYLKEIMSSLAENLRSEDVSGTDCKFLIRCGRWTDMQGMNRLAERFYQIVIELAESESITEYQVQALEELGDHYRIQGRFSDAQQMQETAADIAENSALYNLQAHALNNLAVIAVETGELTKATDLLNQALQLLEKIPEPLLEGHIYNNLGVIKCIQGQSVEAIPDLNRALIIRSQVRDRKGFTETSHNLGMAAMDSGNYSVSEDLLAKALASAQTLNNRYIEANILLTKAELMIKINQPVIALATASKTCKLHQEFNDPLGIADSYRISGLAEMELMRYESAEKYLKNGLQLNQKFKHILGQAQCMEHLSQVANGLNRPEDQKLWAEKALKLWQELNNQEAVNRLKALL